MSDARDLTPPEAKPLTPANQNPWYVLMTLYGEQEGELVNQELHKKNRAAWNAWASQKLTETERKAPMFPRLTDKDLQAYPDLKHEIAVRHQEAWKLRNPKGLLYPGLPFSGSLIDCRDTLFLLPIHLADFVFSSEVSFEGAAFRRKADFCGVNFLRDVNFNCAKFVGEARFALAEFVAEAWIKSATFASDAYFVSATFHQLTRFDFSIFEEIAEFSGATFVHGVGFSAVSFGKEAAFHRTTFCDSAWYNEAKFLGLCYFVEAKFRASGEERSLWFGNSYFENPTSFRGARFGAIYPDFEGAVLHAETAFTAEKKDADGPFWPENPKDPKTAKDSCAKIRNNIGKQGFPEAEHFFYRKEMRFAGLAATNPFEKLAYRLFGLLSDYGYSFVRPLAALALVFGFGFLAHWGYFLGGATRAETGWTAFGISFANMFPYFGIGRYFDPKALQMLPTALKAIGAMQTVFGAVLLFLLALGLRTRFRMR